jgi:hypothetical protein
VSAQGAGAVGHPYLHKIIEQYCKVSPREIKLIDAFLEHTYATGLEEYRQSSFQSSRIGFPQGSTISLFLAKMACIELDREIEKTGAMSARYADDTVILCDDYASAHRLAGIMLEHGYRSGAAINVSKSPGISLVADPSGTELKAKQSFTFLGHQISPSGVSPSARAINRIKRNVSTILYRHLLLHTKRGAFNPFRISRGTDWDSVTCINELRRYLYGSISAAHLDGALLKQRPLKLSMCALSYFPNVRNAVEFTTLDGWLADMLFRTYEKRRSILAALGIRIPTIHKNKLIDGSWYHGALSAESVLPSAVKSWRYVRKCYLAFGVRLYAAPPPYNW